MKVNIEEKVCLSSVGASRDAKAIYGTTRSLIANMVQGVTENFSKIFLLKELVFGQQLKAA